MVKVSVLPSPGPFPLILANPEPLWRPCTFLASSGGYGTEVQGQRFWFIMTIGCTLWEEKKIQIIDKYIKPKFKFFLKTSQLILTTGTTASKEVS